MKPLGPLYYSCQEPCVYSLNITTFCDTFFFKYKKCLGPKAPKAPKGPKGPNGPKGPKGQKKAQD
jgi:hypothetical protein